MRRRREGRTFARVPVALRTRFGDRHDAGRELAAALAYLQPRRPVVIGLPRGGVVVASEVARALAAPLDVVVAHKIAPPGQPEYAIGAVGEDGVVFVDEQAVAATGVSPRRLEAIVAREHEAVERRARGFHSRHPRVPVEGRLVLLVDDGVATGATVRAAARVLRHRRAARVVLAVPVGPPDVERQLAGEVDEVVCLSTPDLFFAVGQAYDCFDQTSDAEVDALLATAADAR
jgi:predicted phosphoribosyltransferase